MINLNSEPSVGSLILTRDGVWKYSYLLPRGMEFPLGSEAQVVVTDRGGAVLASFDGEVSETRADFLVEPDEHENIPAGSNWELFVTVDGYPYKVRYGRVIRREVAYPLNPVTSDTFDAVQYEDTLDRAAVGPFWVNKSGRVAMHNYDTPPPSYALGVRSTNFFIPLTLYADAAVLWYAPVRSDTVAVSFKLVPGGTGATTIILCSNQQMTNYMGVKFDTASSPDKLRIVTGSGPLTTSTVGSPIDYSVVKTDLITVKYSSPLNTISVYKNTDLTPILEWEDAGNVVTHGMGHRYVGAHWLGNLGAPPPLLWYFKAMDDV